MSIQGITEQDIADFLANTPGFFERHAELLSTIQLISPHGQRAVSLQERQMEMLRDKIKGLEGKLIEMIRNGQENTAIADKLHRWTRAMMLAENAADVPDVLVDELQHEFLIPHAGVRVWGTAAEFAEYPYARAVGEEFKRFASSLSQPYCGVNTGFEAVQWLESPRTIMSLAMIPLREPQATRAFGLLALGSPDPTRYSADMGTEFLSCLGEIASAALARVLDRASVSQT